MIFLHKMFAYKQTNDYLYNIKKTPIKSNQKTRIMEKRNFRAKVMKYAHQLRNITGKSWKFCMLKAWELYRLAKRMREGVVKFAYEKKDGSIRLAMGTLQNLPSGAVLNGKRMTKPSFKTFSYFDTAKSEFRCFKIENLVTVY